MKLRIIPLEERIVFDAAAVGVIADVAHAMAHEHGGHSGHEGVNVLVVSTDVENYQQLDQAAKPGVIVINYNPQTTSLTQLESMIQTDVNGHPINNLAFVTHGSENSFDLTSSLSITTQNVNSASVSQFFQAIGSDLSTSGRIELLGCNIGEGSDGLALIGAMQAESGHSVAAATDTVGNPSSGGSWFLAIGHVNAQALLFTPSLLSQWDGTLGPLTITFIAPTTTTFTVGSTVTFQTSVQGGDGAITGFTVNWDEGWNGNTADFTTTASSPAVPNTPPSSAIATISFTFNTAGTITIGAQGTDGHGDNTNIGSMNITIIAPTPAPTPPNPSVPSSHVTTTTTTTTTTTESTAVVAPPPAIAVFGVGFGCPPQICGEGNFFIDHSSPFSVFANEGQVCNTEACLKHLNAELVVINIGSLDYNPDHGIPLTHGVTFEGNPDDTYTVHLQVTKGKVSLANKEGLTFQTGTGNDDSDIIFTGTLSKINQALDGMVYHYVPGVGVSDHAKPGVEVSLQKPGNEHEPAKEIKKEIDVNFTPEIAFTDSQVSTFLGDHFVLAPDAKFSDITSTSFVNGLLVIDYVSPTGADTATPHDQLSLLQDSTVKLVGDKLQINDKVVATVKDGTNGKGLVVEFNDASTPSDVTIVLRHVTYTDSSATLDSAKRVARFTVVDGSNNTYEQYKFIEIKSKP